MIFILLDLKKALDFINHKLLLSKLAHYGVRGLQLPWLSDYLSNRSQKTRINGKCFGTEQILAGYPQGSILSGLQFNFFINDIFQLVIPVTEIFLYAEDNCNNNYS